MTELIEKVARAIYAETPDAFGRKSFDQAPPLARRMACEQARAAIAAMREPTPQMVAAAEDQHVRQVNCDETVLWRTMIDAALNGDPGEPCAANDDYRDELHRFMRRLGASTPGSDGPEPATSAAVFATYAAAAAAVILLALAFFSQQ